MCREVGSGRGRTGDAGLGEEEEVASIRSRLVGYHVGRTSHCSLHVLVTKVHAQIPSHTTADHDSHKLHLPAAQTRFLF
jgi:hypothetical protein